jgi:hypothetical protein
VTINYHWHDYIDSPELRKNLVQRKSGFYYELYDTHRKIVVLKQTYDLSRYLYDAPTERAPGTLD